jgi:hypothetical protein
MKCNYCKKEFDSKLVAKRYGTYHYVDYGCCSENCYTKIMSGEPPLEEPKNTSTQN